MNLQCWLLVLLFTLGSTLPAHSQYASQPATQDQSTFSTEEAAPGEPRVKGPVPIPNAVLELMKADDGVRSCLENNPLTQGQSLNSWFMSSGIHLDDRSKMDILIMPSYHGKESLCFESASGIGTFWIFRKTGEQYQLVLKANGNGLEVLKTKDNGYRDIQTGTILQAGRFITTASFRFDGKAYRKYKEKTQKSRWPIRP